jgi:predicted nucleic acid-binding protein
VTYLLDVNVLLALHYKEHIHHERAARWVQCLRTNDREPDQTTDGHLLQLASLYGATFATLDSGIPGALLIPELPHDAHHVSEPQVTYGAAA